MTGGGTPQRLDADRGHRGTTELLTPELGPPWLRPLIDNVGEMPEVYKRRLPADVRAMVTASKALNGAKGREAAVLVLFSVHRSPNPVAPQPIPCPTTPTCC